jgi:hypothetical protein
MSKNPKGMRMPRVARASQCAWQGSRVQAQAHASPLSQARARPLLCLRLLHGPVQVGGVVPRAVDVQICVLNKAFREGVHLVLDLGGGHGRWYGDWLGGHGGHSGDGFAGVVGDFPFDVFVRRHLHEWELTAWC